jgi:hypothetical protein
MLYRTDLAVGGIFSSNQSSYMLNSLIGRVPSTDNEHHDSAIIAPLVEMERKMRDERLNPMGNKICKLCLANLIITEAL